MQHLNMFRCPSTNENYASIERKAYNRCNMLRRGAEAVEQDVKITYYLVNSLNRGETGLK